jgi:hypothetical protein
MQRCARRPHKRPPGILRSRADRRGPSFPADLRSVDAGGEDLDAGVCNASLRSVASTVPNIRMIFVVDLQGRPVCGSVEATAGVTFSDRDYFKAAVAGKDFVVVTYTQSRMSDTAVRPVSMPVVVDCATRAIVVSGVKLDWLQNRIAERGVAPGNAVTITDNANATVVLGGCCRS